MLKPILLFFAYVIFSSTVPAKANDMAGHSQPIFSLCGRSERINCIVDGDTFWFHGQKIRIADIDTPETFRPACAYEKALGQKAKIALLGLLNQGPFTMTNVERDRDYFGRRLRIIKRSGASLGTLLIKQNLARRWDGSRKSWCS